MASVTSGTGLSAFSKKKLDAFGATPQTNQAQSGVNPGGTGYVSGQVAPSGSATKALGSAAPPPSPPGGDGSGTGPYASGSGGLVAPGEGVGGGWRPSTGSQAPLPGFGGGWRADPNAIVARGTPGGTTTRQSALAGVGPFSSPAASGQPGMSNQNTGTYNNPALISTGNEGVDRILDPGGIFKGATMTDTGPARAAQSAAFGIQDNLDRERYDYQPGSAAYQDRVALDKAQSDEIRARQNAALDALTAAANGTVPSAAELAMQRQAGKNVAATLGQARALGGRSAGGAARAGTLAAADLLADTTAQGAQLRAAEQANARNALVQAAQGVRGQDIDVANADARLAQDANANNLRSQLEQNELADRHRLALLDAQLKALGIGSGAAASILNAGAANANAQNKFNAGILDSFGGIFGS